MHTSLLYLEAFIVLVVPLLVSTRADTYAGHSDKIRVVVTDLDIPSLLNAGFLAHVSVFSGFSEFYIPLTFPTTTSSSTALLSQTYISSPRRPASTPCLLTSSTPIPVTQLRKAIFTDQ